MPFLYWYTLIYITSAIVIYWIYDPIIVVSAAICSVILQGHLAILLLLDSLLAVYVTYGGTIEVVAPHMQMTCIVFYLRG